ncbi:chitin synthase chs-2-like [Acanthochromis polyacanthus]|uniref:chitin synthase chs-2-like n=1 Tax=Acanthochromis polyacanthus TaxID=80966 RepID=UPI002234D5EF|nr:chitin synthase chs-2-like [Acanthochromis polyacanthus]
MPHLDIVTNVTILNSVAIFSALLQMVAQCTSKERNRFLLSSITAFILILLGSVLFLVLYIIKDPTDTQMAIWVGLAVGGAFLVSLNWWENYFRVISENTNSTFLKNLCRDVRRCRNMLHILSSLIRIVVTACVLGAYIPLANMDWDIVTSIPNRETRIIAIIIGVQLISSALCHWFSLVACKMHALRRLDKYRPKTDEATRDVTFEGHIYFDDAFRDVPGSQGRHVNEYAEMLVDIIREVYSIFVNADKDLFNEEQQIPDQKVVRTPYGGRVVVRMPHGNSLVVHFKDKQLIRHKKRWSQVMYLYYLLGWKVSTKYFQTWEKGGEEPELKRQFEVKVNKPTDCIDFKEKHNTYLLALDGDTDFQPAAVMLLIDRLKLYPQVGAACGRIHPTGSGPMVWYQKFEYAVGHWLHKTAEHVLGCVLCSPGCFSLFRASALMDDNVMKRYTIKASKARHYIQYDQGEDRWLCTLLLKQGWRVEYNAASDAYTNAPEEFKEFYNQRRRWGPSTMANIVDLLGDSNLITNRNPSMSRPYMLYQLFNLASSILSPSTVVLMIAGCLTVLLDIHPNAALVLAVIPPVIILGISFTIKSDTQIIIAAVMSTLYAFIMMIAAITVIGSMIKDQTILTPSSIFIIALACFYFTAALLHPQEASVAIYGFLYIICIPSAYLLLAIYSMVNMNNVSWGTRETAPPPGASKPATDPPQTALQKAKSKITKFFSRAKCCRKPCQRGSTEELLENQEDKPEPEPEPEAQPQNSIVEDVRNPEEGQREEEPIFDCPNQCWISQLKSLSDDMHLQEDTLEQHEEEFFRELIAKYLEPLPENKKKQKKMTKRLKEMRNKISFVYFICNAFWLITTFALQLLDNYVSIQVPKLDSNLQFTGEYIYIDPVGFMFILAFALLVIIQFFAMLYHRVCTLIHYVAFLDTETVSYKQRQQVQQIADEELDDSDDFLFPNLPRRSYEQGTLV